ncbi:hypothetical protein ZWY2020_019923 [Hordeum vulgare]|nr:hypothetical protein ZWY2020_019923 [Hordeum vulgare]
MAAQRSDRDQDNSHLDDSQKCFFKCMVGDFPEKMASSGCMEALSLLQMECHPRQNDNFVLFPAGHTTEVCGEFQWSYL